MTKSILDQLDEADKAATPAPYGLDADGNIFKQSTVVIRDLDNPNKFDHIVIHRQTQDEYLHYLMRNHIRPLLDLAKAAEAYRAYNSVCACIHCKMMDEALVKLKGEGGE